MLLASVHEKRLEHHLMTGLIKRPKPVSLRTQVIGEKYFANLLYKKRPQVDLFFLLAEDRTRSRGN